MLMKIKSTHKPSQGDYVLIEAEDFNPEIHEKYEEEAEAKAEAKPEPKKKGK